VSDECHIRHAKPSDLHDIVALCHEHAVYERALWTNKGKVDGLSQALFGPLPRLWCLVAELRATIVGYATYTRDFSTWRTSEFVHMDCLFVREPYRRSGIGHDMIHAIANEARRLGCSEVEWQTPSWNIDAARFYERLGATADAKLRYVWCVTKDV
jgi:GNAT superfamily N-acetyltransferase